jgi:C1A family cysteine protease
VPLPFELPRMVPATQALSRAGAPASYDLRTLNKVTPVKDQSPYGTCWAFATFGSMESNLMPSYLYDFSEDNLVRTAGFDLNPYTGGGNELMSAAYLAHGNGPVSEADDPYGDSVTPAGIQPRMRLLNMSYICNDYYYQDPNKDMTNDIALIKGALQAYGGLYTSMNWNSTAYRAATCAYYGGTGYYYLANEGHAVTIVGWDDNYSAANFTTAAFGTPAGNGAWIIKNSWGTSWGNQGYFYLSYYDYWAERTAVSFQPMNVGTYTTTYQWDPLGWCWNIGWGSDSGWGANDFTAASSDPVYGISFVATAPGTVYAIYTASTHAGARTLRASDTVSYAGYHYISFASPLAVTNGQSFSIVINVTTPGYNYPLAVEGTQAGYSSTATSSAGQSFISTDGGSSWTDIGDPSSLNENLCIKAFSRPSTADTTPPVTTAAGVSCTQTRRWTATPTDRARRSSCRAQARIPSTTARSTRRATGSRSRCLRYESTARLRSRRPPACRRPTPRGGATALRP